MIEKDSTGFLMRKFDRSLLPESPDLSLETALWADGLQLVGGVDEAGRGALAGPVAAAVVILPANPLIVRDLSGVRDSKQMKPFQREYWRERIFSAVPAYGVGFADNREIDQIGIVPAVRLAIQRALEQLPIRPQHLLVDYLSLPDLDIPQTSLVKGDARSLTIAAASVLAKTARDECMCSLEIKYPGYGFGVHKGYGTEAHRMALEKLGPCPAHRTTFQFHT